MTAIIYILGLAIGISAFLYVTQVVQSGKDKLKSKKNVKQNSKTPKKNTPQISNNKTLQIPPGERMCPICRSYLEKWEPLYSSKTNNNGEAKILIHGCKYCYKDK